MATNQLTEDPQLKTQIKVLPRDFTYNYGEWRKPTEGDQTAELRGGNKIEATAAVNIEALGSKKLVFVTFVISKPNVTIGWRNADLMISLGHGSQSTKRSINAEYVGMRPGFPMSFYTRIYIEDGAEKELLHLSLVDDTEHPKGGLVFHEVHINDFDAQPTVNQAADQ